ncbi:MAG: PDZ domain-containing protein, partial [Thiohalomonadales bacterium]
HNAKYNLMSYIPEYTMAGYKKIIPERIISKRSQEVILSRVLPDAVNQGYKDLEGAVIYSINNIEIKDIKHLAKTVDAAEGEYLTIITDLGNVIVLDLAKAKKKNEKILKNYQVYKDRSGDL